MSEIRFAAWPLAAVAYHVLAHLDLGRDAASLFDDTLPARPWAEPLLHAWRAAPGRLAIHGAPLAYGDALIERLRDDPPPSLRDDPGRTLARRFADAIVAESPGYLASLPATRRELVRARELELRDALVAVRGGLWPAGPPALVVVDVAALRGHGRGTGTADGRVAATDCTDEPGAILCQILHEEVHAVTDAAVLAGRPAASRDTATGTPGFALHRELERVAVEVGQAVIEARAPAWRDAYARWRQRHGM